MSFCKVFLELLVIEVVLWVCSAISPITNMASFVLLSAMSIQLIVPLEPLLTETTLWVSFKARLIYCAWIVIAISLVLPEFSI